MSVRVKNPIALTVIQEEHAQLSAVLQSMLYAVRAIGAEIPDLKIFRAMLYYIKEYPDRVHHPKEDDCLFAKIKERTHQLDAELDALSDQHRRGAHLMQRMQDALLRLEFMGMDALPQFRSLVEQYAHFYHAHMRTEEERVLPIARQVLNDNDWKFVDAEFEENRMALEKSGDRYRYDELFARLTAAACADITELV